MQVFGFKEPALISANHKMPEILPAEIENEPLPVAEEKRPQGSDHSNSTQSEIILFETPLVSCEQPRNSGQASSSWLEPILESSTTVTPEVQGSQTPVFGVPTQDFNLKMTLGKFLKNILLRTLTTLPVWRTDANLCSLITMLCFGVHYTKEGIPGMNLDP